MNKILILMTLLMACFIVTTPVMAENFDVIVRETCKDASTLLSIANWTVKINDAVVPLSFEQEFPCTFGCAEDVHECAPKPYVRQMYLIGIFLFFIFILWLIFRMRRKSW